MRKLLVALATTLIIVMPTVSANAATTIKGSVRGPTAFCPVPEDTFTVSGAGHGRYTFTGADDGTVTWTLVARRLEPNTAYHIFVNSLVVLNGEVSDCTSNEIGAFIADANGDAALSSEDSPFSLTLAPGTYDLQIVVTNIFSHLAFLSRARTVTI